MEFDNLQQFLESMSAPAESSGEFTLSLDEAERKLDQFQLLEPGLYPVFLVASAVAGGASYFRVAYDDEQVSFSYNSQPYPRSELENLRAYRFRNRGDRALRHLAVALLAADRVCETVQLRTAGAVLDLHEDKVTIVPASDARENQVVVTRPRGFLSSFLRRPPDLSETLTLCRHAPLSLQFSDEKRVSRYFHHHDALVHRQFLLAGEIPPTFVRGQVQKVESPGQYCGALAIVTREGGYLTLVVDGLSHRLDVDEPYLGGIFWNNHLKLDLSCTGLVQDETLAEMLSQVWSHLPAMLLERIRAEGALDSDERDLLEQLVPQAIRHYEASDPEAADYLRGWMSTAQSADIHLGQAELMAELRRLGPEDSSARTVALRARLLEELTLAFRKASWSGDRQAFEENLAWLREFHVPTHPTLEALAEVVAARSGDLPTFSPVDSDSFVRKVVCLRYLGAYDEATRLCEEGAERFSYRQDFFAWQVELLLLSEPNRALAVAQRAAQAFQGRPRGHYDLQERQTHFHDLIADCHDLLGEPKAALAARLKALEETTPDSYLAYFRLRYLTTAYRGHMAWLEWVRREVETRRLSWRARQGRDASAAARDQVRQKLFRRLIAKQLAGLESTLLEVAKGYVFDREVADYLLGRLNHLFRQRGQSLEGERLLAQVRLNYHIETLTNSFLY
ncbi:MAG: hypothetical protein AB7S38_41495 [Vulcanimicrobiota bacterium]